MKDPRTYRIYIAVVPQENDFPLPDVVHIETSVTASASDRSVASRAASVATEARRMAIALDRAIDLVRKK